MTMSLSVSATFTNNGTFTNANRFTNTTTFTNGSGATFEATSGSMVTNSGAFSNAGTFNNAGGEFNNSSGSFRNSGTFHNRSGSKFINENGSLTNSGGTFNNYTGGAFTGTTPSDGTYNDNITDSTGGGSTVGTNGYSVAFSSGVPYLTFGAPSDVSYEKFALAFVATNGEEKPYISGIKSGGGVKIWLENGNYSTVKVYNAPTDGTFGSDTLLAQIPIELSITTDASITAPSGFSVARSASTFSFKNSPYYMYFIYGTAFDLNNYGYVANVAASNETTYYTEASVYNGNYFWDSHQLNSITLYAQQASASGSTCTITRSSGSSPATVQTLPGGSSDGYALSFALTSSGFNYSYTVPSGTQTDSSYFTLGCDDGWDASFNLNVSDHNLYNNPSALANFKQAAESANQSFNRVTFWNWQTVTDSGTSATSIAVPLASFALDTPLVVSQSSTSFPATEVSVTSSFGSTNGTYTYSVSGLTSDDYNYLFYPPASVGSSPITLTKQDNETYQTEEWYAACETCTLGAYQVSTGSGSFTWTWTQDLTNVSITTP